MNDWVSKADNLTSSELATYQALRARGWSHEDSLNDALDGVDVETVRDMDPRPHECGRDFDSSCSGCITAMSDAYGSDPSKWY